MHLTLGLPVYPGLHWQMWDPLVLVHTLFSPQVPGVRHSSTSIHPTINQSINQSINHFTANQNQSVSYRMNPLVRIKSFVPLCFFVLLVQYTEMTLVLIFSPAFRLVGSQVHPSLQTQQASFPSGRQQACSEQETPWQGSLQPTEGGDPTLEGRQEQEKLPGVLRHTALGPQMPGVAPHSSTSTHSVPKFGEGVEQLHCSLTVFR